MGNTWYRRCRSRKRLLRDTHEAAADIRLELFSNRSKLKLLGEELLAASTDPERTALEVDQLATDYLQTEKLVRVLAAFDARARTLIQGLGSVEVMTSATRSADSILWNLEAFGKTDSNLRDMAKRAAEASGKLENKAEELTCGLDVALDMSMLDDPDQQRVSESTEELLRRLRQPAVVDPLVAAALAQAPPVPNRQPPKNGPVAPPPLLAQVLSSM